MCPNLISSKSLQKQQQKTWTGPCTWDPRLGTREGRDPRLGARDLRLGTREGPDPRLGAENGPEYGMQVRLLSIQGFRSEMDLKTSPTRTTKS